MDAVQTRTMIARTAPPWQTAAWQKSLAQAIRDPAELLRALQLPTEFLAQAVAAGRRFPLCVPRSYLARMEPGNPNDPLLRQILPLGAELQTVPGFAVDPVGDLGAMPRPGLLHKYAGRVLLVTTGACAVHCRYCFRRHFPYGEANPAAGTWQPALEYIAADPSIEEVILSGGDPLSLSDRRLAALSAHLATIPHLRRLRIHTRHPVVLPERVDAALLEWLQADRLQKIMVIHANHPRELDASVMEALARLRTIGVTLLNQSVLLRDVNDSVTTLVELSERLFTAGVLPYYLHLLDRVAGAHHFDVPAAEAADLIQGLRVRLPGYLVPRLVREDAGAPCKTPVDGRR